MKKVQQALGTLGDYLLFLRLLFVRMESLPTYVKLVFHESYTLGYKSVLIFSLISFFMGAVSVIQTAYNIVNPFVPDYIIAVVVRDTSVTELAPMVMSIFFAGKIGANMASELGTMRISEQIDALKVMGINPVSYLVLPKILASVIMYPILIILSIVICIYGGYVAGSISGVITPTEYIYGIRTDLIPFSVYFSMIKTIVFSFLISSISCYVGYQVKGGAFQVGQASTRAVTSSCIAILCGDYVLAEVLL